ncbi:hypothetical protein V039C_0046 [Vibrio phage V039C]|nr:hypothetical protein V039C_0046 [Vibrio phage V039C]
MKTINSISNIPNQTIQVPIGDYDYKIRFIYCDGFMAYDFYIDDEVVVQGYRMTIGQLIMPYAYQEVDGNFILDTDGSDIDYKEFGVTQFLRYLNAEESADWREALRNGGR